MTSFAPQPELQPAPPPGGAWQDGDPEQLLPLKACCYLLTLSPLEPTIHTTTSSCLLLFPFSYFLVVLEAKGNALCVRLVPHLRAVPEPSDKYLFNYLIHLCNEI